MAKPDTSFKVRMDDELRNKIGAAALANNRSINSEIVNRLEDSFNNKVEALIEADYNLYVVRLLLSYFDFYEDIINAYVVNNPEFTENKKPAERVILRQLQSNQPNIDRIRSEFSLDARSPGNWVRPKMGIEDQIDAKADENERIRKESGADAGSPKKSPFRDAGSEE